MSQQLRQQGDGWAGGCGSPPAACPEPSVAYVRRRPRRRTETFRRAPADNLHGRTGPDHPLFPGVGFSTFPELSWRSFEGVAEIVRIGPRVSCVFLQFDTWKGEAGLSLSFQAFAEVVVVGQRLSGRVGKLLPFGGVAEVADGVEGVVHRRELAGAPTDAPGDGVSLGDDIGAGNGAEMSPRRTLTQAHPRDPEKQSDGDVENPRPAPSPGWTRPQRVAGVPRREPRWPSTCC